MHAKNTPSVIFRDSRNFKQLRRPETARRASAKNLHVKTVCPVALRLKLSAKGESFKHEPGRRDNRDVRADSRALANRFDFRGSFGLTVCVPRASAV